MTGSQRTHPSQLATDGSLPHFVNPQTATWERLEALRLKRLGLSNKYSRHFNVLRTSSGALHRATNLDMEKLSFTEDRLAMQGMVPPERLANTGSKNGKESNNHSNSLAPFSTVGKPTCGYFFSRVTDNKKKKFGIPPSDLVKWRNFAASNTAQ